MAEEEKDRSEPATPFKLEEARRRGQVAKSVDFNSLFVVGALVAVIYGWADGLTRTAGRLGALLLERSPQVVENPVLWPWLSAVLTQTLVMIAPFFAVALVAAVLANLVQTGVTLTAFPLKPDFQRLNPVNGFKRLFSLRTLYESAKTVVKFIALSVVAYLAIAALLPALFGIQQGDPRTYMPLLLDHAASLLFKLLLVLTVVALLDLAFTRWEFGKRMMMSRRELKEEVKRREGDPAIRARLRELQQEMVRRAKSLKRVPEADVLITNPEHYAVALRYERRTMRAPCVVAKGAGDLAQRMKRVAAEHGVPLIESKALAQRLFTEGEIDQPVAAELFEPVARVYSEVYARRDAQPGLEIPQMITALRKMLGAQADLFLVIGVIVILLVLFAPIPPGLLDFLLIANFAIALLVLLLTFYMAKPLEFSTFPSLLLMATLFRLALNVSATRLVLRDAYAGEVIGSIGNYVVSGNYVIGLIVFVVLIVVQYVVVTNGAQRVAEVAARFTLDSMPGKQMSVDADLNMGLIDQDQARERRRSVEREANFYGAMDGASRFVKGDAIAGIIIVLINIIGGLAIGIAQLGMSWGEALQTYTLLTVGDGIVTQVPALIVATATGIIVTRAATDSRLGDEVAKQVLSQPKTILLVGGCLVALLLLPGMPVLPIFALLVVFALIYAFARSRQSTAAAGEVQREDAKRERESEDLYRMLAVEPIELSIGQNLIPLVGGEASLFMERVVAFRKQFALEMGMVFPRVRVKDEKRQPPNRYELRVFGTRVADGEVLADRVLAINPGGAREALEGLAAKDPTYGLPSTWIVEDQKRLARDLGYTVVDPVTVLLTHFTEVIRQQASNLLTRAETERLINRVREDQAGLVEELVPKLLSMGEVQKVLQNLLRERVPIRNVEAILEVLSDHGNRVKEADQLTELARERLGPAICQGLATPKGELYVLTLDPTVEQQITSAIRAVDEKAALVIEPRLAEQLLRKLAAEVDRMLGSELMPVLLCPPGLRRHLRRFTERLMPQLSVLSLSEVPNTVSLKAFGMVSV